MRLVLQPHFRSLGPLEGAALDLIAAGTCLGATCEHLSVRFPELDIASEVGALLRRWVDEELLARVTAPGG